MEKLKKNRLLWMLFIPLKFPSFNILKFDNTYQNLNLQNFLVLFTSVTGLLKTKSSKCDSKDLKIITL